MKLRVPIYVSDPTFATYDTAKDVSAINNMTFNYIYCIIVKALIQVHVHVHIHLVFLKGREGEPSQLVLLYCLALCNVSHHALCV